MDHLQVLDLIYLSLRQYKHAKINDVTMDSDNHDGEIILTTDDDDGKRQVWVIGSNDITETDDDE